MVHVPLHIRPRGPEGPKKFAWMKNLHGTMHGTDWMMFHGLPNIAFGPSNRGGSDAKLENVANT